MRPSQLTSPRGGLPSLRRSAHVTVLSVSCATYTSFLTRLPPRGRQDAEKLDEWTRAAFYERRDATQGVRDARQAAYVRTRLTRVNLRIQNANSVAFVHRIDAKLAELGYGRYET